MTKDRLDQYLALKKEISLLESEIQNISSRKKQLIRDVVSGSSRDHPYIRRSFTIAGLEAKDDELIARKRARLVKRKENAAMEAEEIDKFIDQVEDSYMRQVLSLKYLKGLSWGQVACRLGGKNTEDGVKQACHRFLKRQSCHDCHEPRCYNASMDT